MVRNKSYWIDLWNVDVLRDFEVGIFFNCGLGIGIGVLV